METRQLERGVGDNLTDYPRSHVPPEWTHSLLKSPRMSSTQETAPPLKDRLFHLCLKFQSRPPHFKSRMLSGTPHSFRWL